MKEWFKGTFQDKDGHWSSKSQAGTLGIVVLLACYVYVVYKTCQLPSVTEFMTGSFVTLLSVNKVSDAVSNLNSNNNNESKSDTNTED